jgi:hypothetical protein
MLPLVGARITCRSYGRQRKGYTRGLGVQGDRSAINRFIWVPLFVRGLGHLYPILCEVMQIRAPVSPAGDTTWERRGARFGAGAGGQGGGLERAAKGLRALGRAGYGGMDQGYRGCRGGVKAWSVIHGPKVAKILRRVNPKIQKDYLPKILRPVNPKIPGPKAPKILRT